MNVASVASWISFLWPRYLLFIGAAMDKLINQIKAHIHRSSNTIQVILLHLELGNYDKVIEYVEEAEAELKAVGVLASYVLQADKESHHE